MTLIYNFFINIDISGIQIPNMGIIYSIPGLCAPEEDLLILSNKNIEKLRCIVSKLPEDTQNNILMIIWFEKCFKKVNYIEKIIQELNKSETLIDSFFWHPNESYDILYIDLKIFSLVSDVEYTLSAAINIKTDTRHQLLII
jgi:hypothetical protein